MKHFVANDFDLQDQSQKAKVALMDMGAIARPATWGESGVFALDESYSPAPKLAVVEGEALYQRSTYGEDRNRFSWPVLGGIIAFHLIIIAVAFTMRYQAAQREQVDQVTTFSISEPPPAPPQNDPQPVMESQPVATPVVMPEPRIKLDNSSTVPAIPDAPIANAELPVMQVAVNTPVAPAAAPPAPAPIVPPDFSAGQLNNPGPSYPYLSRKAKEQGVVLLRVLVSADGRADTLKIEKTSGFDRLDKAALATVKKWRFVPASQAGKPKQAWVLVPITFSLGR